jgi:hypothetical protein
MYQTFHVTKLKKKAKARSVVLPFTLKRILRQRKNSGNSNISPCKDIILKKSSKKKNQNPSKYYDPITNLKFQHKPKYHLQKSLYQNKPIITLGPKSLKLLYSIMNVNTISFLVGKANKQGGASHCGIAIYIEKYLRGEEELQKLKYLTIIFKKILQNEPNSFKIL